VGVKNYFCDLNMALKETQEQSTSDWVLDLIETPNFVPQHIDNIKRSW
jgi:hypothetical protein